MSIYGACMLFVALIAIYALISEFFAVLFRFTGVSISKAGFQVPSLLTGCGFTTTESEILLSSPLRRKLARVTMLFGYTFNVTIVSALINIFLSLSKAEFKSVLVGVPSTAVILIILLTIWRMPSVKKHSHRLIENMADKVINKYNKNRVLLLDYICGTAGR